MYLETYRIRVNIYSNFKSNKNKFDGGLYWLSYLFHHIQIIENPVLCLGVKFLYQEEVDQSSAFVVAIATDDYDDDMVMAMMMMMMMMLMKIVDITFTFISSSITKLIYHQFTLGLYENEINQDKFHW